MANCTDFVEEESQVLLGMCKKKYQLSSWRAEEPRQIQRMCENLLIKKSIDKRIGKEKFKEGS